MTFWSGKQERIDAPANTKADLERLRRYFFEKNYDQGENLAKKILQPTKGNYGTSLPLCNLHLRFDPQGECFKRELDLEQALVSISYRTADAVHKREIFASHVDGVIASRIWSRKNRSVSFTISMEGKTDAFLSFASKDVIRFSAQALESMHSDGTCGVCASGLVKVVTKGGSMKNQADNIVVQNADEAVIYVAVATDYPSKDEGWTQECESQLDDAVAKGYDRLKSDHIHDYRRLFSRVILNLGDNARSDLPTDERINLLREVDEDDPQLFTLFYQYGRYLMIAGSRANSPLPMHLQGIWNDGEANRMQWSCDYHLDINTQMNYYPVETGNLPECHLPLLRFVKKLAEAGRKAARHFYDCDGWVAHVFTNAWGFTSPGWETSWGLNVTGGLWIAAQLLEHYEFNLDHEFLRNMAYPVLKEAAVFFLDYMAVHPQYGWLVTGPSNSPENSFYVDGNRDKAYQLSMGTTLDQILVRDIFEFCLEISQQLGTDQELQHRLRQAIALLPPLQIGNRGQLQEWLEDYEEAQPGHRHLSHLYGLYPGRRVSPVTTPEFATAARKTLENRISRSELEDVEFTLALFAACFARLRDGDAALQHLSHLIGKLCFNNLFTYSKAGIAGAETNIFVIDGNFGGTAAIAEMFLQSRMGEIDLLPALPSRWQSGSVRGLKARGNMEVDISWEQGRLAEAAVRSFSTGRTVVRYGKKAISLLVEPGGHYRFDGELQLIHE